MAPGGLSFIHMDPEGPTPGIGGHTILGALDDEAIDAFVAVAGAGSGTPLVMAELRQLGGAVARSGEHHGAVDVMPGEFALFAVGAFHVIRKTDDPFVRIVSGAITVWIVGQALINIGVVLRVFPVLGVPLPFMSQGGTSLLSVLVASGVLLSFARTLPAAEAKRRAAIQQAAARRQRAAAAAAR